MKKILLSTIVLTAFAFSIILFEISCQKDAVGQINNVLPIATTSKLGGVIPDGSTITVDAMGKISAVSSSAPQAGKILYSVPTSASINGIAFVGAIQIWQANYDGTSPQQINPNLPSGYVIMSIDAISPDHKTLFFGASQLTIVNGYSSVTSNTEYSCNIDGTNLKKAGTNQVVIAY